MSKATIVIVVELDEKADCPSGTAVGIDGRTQPFHGWVGLAKAVTELAHTDGPSVAPGAPTHTPTHEGAST